MSEVLNCAPFARQYGKMSDEWGVYYAERETPKTGTSGAVYVP